MKKLEEKGEGKYTQMTVPKISHANAMYATLDIAAYNEYILRVLAISMIPTQTDIQF
jgi:hypothetical protein